MADVSIIGSGFSGLAAACYAARDGLSVSVFEKNSTVGGRARQFSEGGFIFDMGPSWYWMPDVFERFFNDFGKSTSDYYDLVQLDPGFKVFYKDAESLAIPSSIDELYASFETIEKGSSEQLKRFLKDASYKYDVGMKNLVYKPGLSLTEYMNYDVLKGVLKTHLFKSVKSHVGQYFKEEKIRQLMEFPVLFLGAMANDIPALYTLMNYAALSLGTWYPMGGMYKIVEAMSTLAEELGVNIYTNAPVQHISVKKNYVQGIIVNNELVNTSSVISSGDYHYTEQHLLDASYRNYNEEYWNKKTFAPSCLLYYVGVNKRVKGLDHHNLFFDADFDKHADEIYKVKEWPTDPLFYVCSPSKTDDSVAPNGCENLFILIPIAPGIEDNEEIRERYFPQVISRIEKHTGDSISDNIVYKKSYCIKDFVNDYHAYKGNAYGLANTLMQTAFLKPSLKNKKVKNLVYTGQLTVPGPGVPPSLISGRLAAEQAVKSIKKSVYETVV
ncbi:MAG: phytoene desaturase [Chitinophagaceae bacterium]|nr:phytoene desaturase [Chitinophagaceae bacterium]